MNQRHWTIERGPTNKGPWRFEKSLTGDIFDAIRAGLETVASDGWIRLVPDGKVECSTMIKG